jgi:hypothetical protein
LVRGMKNEHYRPLKLAVGTRLLGTELGFVVGRDLQHKTKDLEICKVINQIYFMCTQDDVP